MANGYWNRFLEVDLTKGTWKEVQFDEAYARKYLGGPAFGAQIMLDRIPLHADPLGPDNILLATFGPFSGTFFPGQKVSWMFKSPLTDRLGIGRTRAGGAFTAEVRRAGWDGIIITGKSPQLVYLYIKDDNVEIRDASFLQSKDTQVTEVMIQEQTNDPFIRVACCGPAGENLVRFASIHCETFRAAARTGGGAVMGSKNLKAVAVHGTKVVPMADAAAFNEYVKQMTYRVTYGRGLWPQQFYMRRYHTNHHSAAGHPLRNYTWSGDVTEAFKINTERQSKRFQVRYAACGTFCDGGCHGRGVVRSGPFTGVAGETSEWDTSPTILGPGLTDVFGAVAAVSKLDKFGMDGSSCGHTMAWAIECYDKGLINKDDTGGLELSWDNSELVNKLLRMIAFREGFGDVLAEGSKRAAEYLEQKKGLAPGTLLAYACQNRGLENAAVEPRSSYGVAVGQATSARGSGDHITDSCSTADQLGICMFYPMRGHTNNDVVQLMKYATAWDFSQDEITADFERSVTLQRAFIVREAWPTTPAEVDYNAPKFYTLGIYAGPQKGTKLDKAKFEEERAKYYTARGWDARGIPTKATLTKFGLDEVTSTLEKAGVTLT
jgi:aldehyde:ferredoxin oxidoreductase